MKVAYVILSHEAPDLVVAQVEAILAASRGGVCVVSHESTAESAWISRRVLGPRCFVMPGGKRRWWGEYSLVDASMAAMRTAFERLDADWSVIVSGRCYPAAELSWWERSSLRDCDGLFYDVESVPPPTRGPASPQIVRAAKYTHRWFRVPRVLRPMFGNGMRRRLSWQSFVLLSQYPDALRTHVGFRRRISRSLVLRSAQWCAISRGGFEGIDPRTMRRRFLRTLCPDEAALVTAVGTPPGGVIRDSPISWVHWPPSACHPSDLTPTLVAALPKEPIPFARKMPRDLDDAARVMMALRGRWDPARAPKASQLGGGDSEVDVSKRLITLAG